MAHNYFPLTKTLSITYLQYLIFVYQLFIREVVKNSFGKN